MREYKVANLFEYLDVDGSFKSSQILAKMEDELEQQREE